MGKHRPRLRERELALYRADPQREASLGITAYVVCRECGRPLERLGNGNHLKRDGLTRRQYRTKWPGAPFASVAYRKRENRRSRQVRAANPEKSRHYQQEWWAALPPEKVDRYRRGPDPAKRKQQHRHASAKWRNSHPDQLKEIYRRENQKRVAILRAARAAGLTAESIASLKAPSLPADRAGRKGRKPEEEENKRYFKIGIEVEKEIPAHLKRDRHSIVEARRRVSSATHLEVDVVAQYHKRFRQLCAKTGIEIPA